MEDLKGKKFNSVKSLEKAILKRDDKIYGFSYSFGMYGKNIVHLDLKGFGSIAFKESKFKDKAGRNRKRFKVIAIHKELPIEREYSQCGRYPY